MLKYNLKYTDYHSGWVINTLTLSLALQLYVHAPLTIYTTMAQSHFLCESHTNMLASCFFMNHSYFTQITTVYLTNKKATQWHCLSPNWRQSGKMIIWALWMSDQACPRCRLASTIFIDRPWALSVPTSHVYWALTPDTSRGAHVAPDLQHILGG